MVFQNYALYPHMSVYDNMAFGLKLRKYPKAEIQKRVNEAAAILGIDAGHLTVGAVADVCIFDPEAYWRVEPAALYSLGKNTPFSGFEMRGRVTHTLVSGNLVYEKK